MRLVFFWVTMVAQCFAEKPPDVSANRLSTMGAIAKRTVDAVNSGQISITIQLGGCFNEPDCPESPLTADNTQSETSIAVDSTGQHIVVGFNDFRGFGTTVSISGFTYSDDGGATFVDGGQLPTGPTTVIAGQAFPQVFWRPRRQIARRLHLAQGLRPFEVPAATNPNGQVDVNGDAINAADKELADADPDTNRYGLCWSNFMPAAAGGVEMSCTYSDKVLSATSTFSPRIIQAFVSPLIATVHIYNLTLHCGRDVSWLFRR